MYCAMRVHVKGPQMAKISGGLHYDVSQNHSWFWKVKPQGPMNRAVRVHMGCSRAEFLDNVLCAKRLLLELNDHLAMQLHTAALVCNKNNIIVIGTYFEV